MEIPAEFVATTVESRGEAGRAWLTGLPGLVQEVLEDWSLRPDGPVMHGFAGVVLPVGDAVLKVSWLDDETRWEPYALAAWDGRGAVRLLRCDHARGAMLLERLDPARTVRELDGPASARVMGEVARRLAVPVTEGVAMPRVRDLAEKWAVELPAEWERLGRPFERGWIDAAVGHCRELGPEQPETLVHGDLVLNNVLRADREPWVVIDPQGLVGETAFDAEKLLSNRWSELVDSGDVPTALRARLAAFAEGADVDRERARCWSVVRGVADALWCREHQASAVPYVETMVAALL